MSATHRTMRGPHTHACLFTHTCVPDHTPASVMSWRHMSINAHPESLPPVLYVPVDERITMEARFSSLMFDQTTVLWHTSLDRLLDGIGDDKAGLLSK